MEQTEREWPTSDHFELCELAEGVYAALATEDGAAYSNAGIVDLGGQVLIFDTFNAPQAAADLKAAAEQLTRRPASAAIISHMHPDHWLGSQVFADHAPMIATHSTREAICKAAGEVRALQENPAPLEDMQRADEGRLSTETDPRKRATLQHAISRRRQTLQTLSILEVNFPSLTFDGRLVFHGTRRSAELIARGPGHTASDCALILPSEKIAFVGDLAFFGCQPFMASCIPDAWVAQLEEMERWEIDTFVPGHGPLGSQADLALERQYIIALQDMVARVISEGGTVEDALRRPLPEPFAAWLEGGMARFETNVRFLYQRLSADRPQ